MNLPKLRAITFLLFFLSIAGLAGCTAMPKTHSDFLSAENAIHHEEYEGRNIEVVWRVSDAHDINSAEQALLVSKLESALSESIKNPNKSIQIRAAITRIEAVSPTLNWISSILLFVPMDHGGAAVELEATDRNSHEVISQLRFANWTPISEFSAHFTRLEPANLALAQAAEEFALQLGYL